MSRPTIVRPHLKSSLFLVVILLMQVTDSTRVLPKELFEMTVIGSRKKTCQFLLHHFQPPGYSDEFSRVSEQGVMFEDRKTRFSKTPELDFQPLLPIVFVHQNLVFPAVITIIVPTYHCPELPNRFMRPFFKLRSPDNSSFLTEIKSVVK